MDYYFVAYASSINLISSAISDVASDSSYGSIPYKSWDKKDPSGAPIGGQIEEWVLKSSGVVADISSINDNVTFEIGLAIGAGKSIRIIKHALTAKSELIEVGLFDTVGFDEWEDKSSLRDLLNSAPPNHNKWNASRKARDTPIYMVAPNEQKLELFTSTVNLIKKRMFKKFRSFKQWEISRISSLDLWKNVSQSFGVVTFWSDGDCKESRIANQRNILAFGMARGLDIPTILLCKSANNLPLDVRDLAIEISGHPALTKVIDDFRNQIDSCESEYIEDNDVTTSLITKIEIGDPDAANEQENLNKFFLQTDEFRRVLSGQSNIVVGRKGCGKTAIFLQVRDKIRADRSNIVVDLNPEGSHLLKLKETMLQLKSEGARREFLEAFWQYVCWLEIAYKLLEKDKKNAFRDYELQLKYSELESEFIKRVDTGVGDFSERLRTLIELVSKRMEYKSYETSILKQSSVLEVVHGQEIADFRKLVVSYLKRKGVVALLFDNLDRMRSSYGFNEDDGIIIVSLIEALKQIARFYRKEQIDFQWAVFLRSDVFSFVINDMPDFGKVTPCYVEWPDREMLFRMFELRLLNGSKTKIYSKFEDFLKSSSVEIIDGQSIREFLVDASLMRPRYIIRLFNLARGRAINLGKTKIDEDDYINAKKTLAWDVANDLARELQDILPNSQSLLLDIIELDGACGQQELSEAVVRAVGYEVPQNRVIEILLWSGALGVIQNNEKKFIDSFGFQLSVMMAAINRISSVEFCVHPTLSQISI